MYNRFCLYTPIVKYMNTSGNKQVWLYKELKGMGASWQSVGEAQRVHPAGECAGHGTGQG